MANDLLSVVNNQLQQEDFSSNSRNVREELRRRASDGAYDVAPTSPTTETTPASYKPVDTQGTLANTYSTLLNNFNAMGGGSGSSNSFISPSSESTASARYTGNKSIPSWAPSAISAVGGLTGNSLYGALGSAATNLARGNTAGATGTLASLFTNAVSKGKIPGGMVGTLVSDMVQGKDAKEIGMDLANSGLGYGLSALNPIAGIGYNVARMFGLDVSRGIDDYSKSDISQRFDAGYNGGFWGGGSGNRGSWNPTAPYSPTNTYSGSGEGNTAGPGSGGLAYSGTSSNSGTQSSSNSGYSNPATSYGGW